MGIQLLWMGWGDRLNWIKQIEKVLVRLKGVSESKKEKELEGQKLLLGIQIYFGFLKMVLLSF